MHAQRISICVCIVIIAPFLGTTSSTLAADDAEEILKKEVMRDYPVALSKLEKKYSQMRGNYQKKSMIADPRSGEALSTTTLVSFFVDGDSRKISSRLEASSKIIETQKVFQILCVTPNYSFRLVQRRNEDRPKLVKLRPGEGREIAMEIDSFELYQSIEAPFNVGYRISELLKKPGFAFDHVKEIQVQGRRLLELEHTQFLNNRKDLPNKLTFVVAPDDGWSLQEFHSESRNVRRSLKINYGPQIDGFSVPNSLTRSERNEQVSIVFERLAFGPVPDGEFSLPAAGLPDG